MAQVSKWKIWILRLLLLAGTIFSLQNWNYYSSFVMIYHKNPHPTEYMENLYPDMEKAATRWLISCLIFLSAFVFTFFLKSKGTRTQSNLQQKDKIQEQIQSEDFSKSA